MGNADDRRCAMPGALMSFTPEATAREAASATIGKYTVKVTLHPLASAYLTLSLWRSYRQSGVRMPRRFVRLARRAWRHVRGWHGRWQFEADEAVRAAFKARLRLQHGTKTWYEHHAQAVMGTACEVSTPGPGQIEIRVPSGSDVAAMDRLCEWCRLETPVCLEVRVVES